MMGICGAFSVIPASVLLAISYFVFLSLQKLEEGILKSFGRVIGLLLCAAAVFVFSAGMYMITASSCKMMKMAYYPYMDHKMKMGKMCPMMGEGKMDKMAMPDPTPSPIYIENSTQPTPVHIHISK